MHNQVMVGTLFSFSFLYNIAITYSILYIMYVQHPNISQFIIIIANPEAATLTRTQSTAELAVQRFGQGHFNLHRCERYTVHLKKQLRRPDTICHNIISYAIMTDIIFTLKQSSMFACHVAGWSWYWPVPQRSARGPCPGWVSPTTRSVVNCSASSSVPGTQTPTSQPCWKGLWICRQHSVPALPSHLRR